MSTKPAKAIGLHHPLGRTHEVLTVLASIALAATLSVATARAADTASRPMPARGTAPSWGAGPLTMSLAEAASEEGPVRDVEHEYAPEFTAKAQGLTLVTYPSSAIR